MSFYGYRAPAQRHMGIAWLAPVVQFVGGALQSRPVDSHLDVPQHDSTGTILLAVGGLALLGTLGYLVVRR